MSLKKDPKTRSKNKPLNYKEAGVNVAAGNQLVDQIKHITKGTSRPEVISDLGGFGGLCEIPKKYDHPVLVSATDGVGTKLKLAMAMKQHETIGVDLVAMCVNDLIVCGAEPLFFLDYYATGRLDVDNAQSVIKGIGEGCKQAGCALIGGETAEMPGMYHGEDYDLAGFAVGVVEKTKIIDQSKVSVGDTLIGLYSSGPHSNGYSLIRKIIEVNEIDIHKPFGHKTIGEALLSPTLIYVEALNNLLEQINVHAIAHITGGGLIENVPRVLPENTQARIELSSWEIPPIFSWLQDLGNIEDHEMHRTFNCGLGMIVCIDSEDTNLALKILAQNSIEATTIGQIIKKPKGKNAITLV
tara:strand:+ start:4627 stop:5691 length:1065 start_codon:yes stop_codon:yes gene_type:complete